MTAAALQDVAALAGAGIAAWAAGELSNRAEIHVCIALNTQPLTDADSDQRHKGRAHQMRTFERSNLRADRQGGTAGAAAADHRLPGRRHRGGSPRHRPPERPAAGAPGAAGSGLPGGNRPRRWRRAAPLGAPAHTAPGAQTAHSLVDLCAGPQ